LTADFYNWNRVKIRYCDGSSFTGDVEAVDTVCSELNLWIHCTISSAETKKKRGEINTMFSI
jgi:O-palmitoleoyl-L-serine hydrolase